MIAYRKNSSRSIEPQVNHFKSIVMKPNINNRIKINIPIMILPLVSSFVSDKHLTLEELDQI